MTEDQKILSDIIVHMKYARFREDLGRRETWEEIVDRNKAMHIKKYPHLEETINEAYEFVYDKRVLPSMRSAQFAGKPIEVNESRVYNCCYLPIDDYRAFNEIMFLLLGGTGVGFSVQKHHVRNLPEIRIPTKERKYVVSDSIEGWADAVKALMKAYFGKATCKPRFDFSDIRAKGERLITSGGKAPGPEPLKTCLFKIETLLNRKQNGEKLTPLEAHDIVCHLADAVLAGGIRRAALISLFSLDDTEMLTAKSGNWWELNPQRGRANNSAVVARHRIKKSEFLELWKRIEESGSGEPGIYFTNNIELGTNPCAEISLRPFQFCNLCELNANLIEDESDFYTACDAAATIGTLQAGYTDFHYLRPIWKETTEKEALIGVGITGIASNTINEEWLETGAEVVKSANAQIAASLGINPAARCTTVKPSGTTSIVCGSSSGVHAWHDKHYVRRVRVGKNEAIYKYLQEFHPELIEDDAFNPEVQAVISVPQAAPKGATTRSEDVMDFLERVKTYNIEWVREGHRQGDNTNNVSATVSIKDDEWEKVGEWMWENKETYNGLSVLPYSGHTYKQAPFETITEEEYDKLKNQLSEFNPEYIREDADYTNLQGELACAGNSCEIT